MAAGKEAESLGLRARVNDDANGEKASSSNGPGHHSLDDSPEGITNLLGCGHDIEVHELDKSGNVTQRWLHKPNNQIVPVS